ncbi:hypothetical protein, partial [Kitasatospora sp. LaBMicrA B282]|uniref:hypothetical protein n=1 Tax=Kitasatospora sp. LaBMicrA B282 TaxID=3420949 RepID=UPI003D143147
AAPAGAAPAGGDMAAADAVLIGQLDEERRPAGIAPVERLLRAWRQPTAAAACPATWVYVAETAAGAYLPHVRLGLSPFGLTDLPHYPVEAVARGEQLPPYQAAALAAAVPVWER